jgi:hypothetical protein
MSIETGKANIRRWRKAGVAEPNRRLIEPDE